MGRKLDPTNKVKRGPGKKARKQQGAETELAKFITDGDYSVLSVNSHACVHTAETWPNFIKTCSPSFSVSLLFPEGSEPKRLSSRGRKR